jgi:hypothetical protein
MRNASRRALRPVSRPFSSPMNLKTKSQSAVRIRQVSINKYRSNISALALIKTIPFERIKFLLFLAAFLLLLSGCGKPEEEQDSPEQPPKSVPVAVVKPSPFSETITVTGTLFPKTTSVIAAEASGVVREVSAQEGDSVFAGQQVALFFQNTNTAQGRPAKCTNIASKYSAYFRSHPKTGRREPEKRPDTSGSGANESGKCQKNRYFYRGICRSTDRLSSKQCRSGSYCFRERSKKPVRYRRESQ